MIPSSDIIIRNDTPFRFIERPPSQAGANAPLLVMLHGRAAKAETIFTVQGHFDPAVNVISIQGPYPCPRGEFEWFLPYDYSRPLESFTEEHFRETEDKLTVFIQELMDERKTSSANLFLLGFSQGAAMCHILSLRGKLKPRGVIPMSGFFPRPILGWNNISTMSSYLITHGTEDEVLPESESIFAHEYLLSKGISSQYYTYKGRHKMTIPLLKHTNDWIIEQTHNG
ncbi:MAG: hypothetical protein WCH46_08565 [bacterium]